jgi:hypothetical protein
MYQNEVLNIVLKIFFINKWVIFSLVRLKTHGISLLTVEYIEIILLIKKLKKKTKKRWSDLVRCDQMWSFVVRCGHMWSYVVKDSI